MRRRGRVSNCVACCSSTNESGGAQADPVVAVSQHADRQAASEHVQGRVHVVQREQTADAVAGDLRVELEDAWQIGPEGLRDPGQERSWTSSQPLAQASSPACIGPCSSRPPASNSRLRRAATASWRPSPVVSRALPRRVTRRIAPRSSASSRLPLAQSTRPAAQSRAKAPRGSSFTSRRIAPRRSSRRRWAPIEQRSRLTPRVQAQAAAVGQQPVAALAGAGRQFAGQTHAGLDPALQAGAAGEQDEQPEAPPTKRRRLDGCSRARSTVALGWPRQGESCSGARLPSSCRNTSACSLDSAFQRSRASPSAALKSPDCRRTIHSMASSTMRCRSGFSLIPGIPGSSSARHPSSTGGCAPGTIRGVRRSARRSGLPAGSSGTLPWPARTGRRAGGRWLTRLSISIHCS